MQPIIADNLDALRALCRQFGVRRLEVFGSAGTGHAFDLVSSDVDFLVEFGGSSGLDPLHEYFRLRTALSALMARPVDLVESGAVRNPYVRHAIDKSRQLVFAA